MRSPFTTFAFRRIALVAGLVVANGACTITPAPSSLAGNWSGSFVDGKSNATGSLAATFDEQGDDLSGTLTIASGWACSAATQGDVSGTVTGDQVQASAAFGLIGALSFSGTVSGNTLTGSYTITSGVCSGDAGSFTLTR